MEENEKFYRSHLPNPAVMQTSELRLVIPLSLGQGSYGDGEGRSNIRFRYFLVDKGGTIVAAASYPSQQISVDLIPNAGKTLRLMVQDTQMDHPPFDLGQEIKVPLAS